MFDGVIWLLLWRYVAEIRLKLVLYSYFLYIIVFIFLLFIFYPFLVSPQHARKLLNLIYGIMLPHEHV